MTNPFEESFVHSLLILTALSNNRFDGNKNLESIWYYFKFGIMRIPI